LAGQLLFLGIGKLKTEVLMPVCQIRNTGRKQVTAAEKASRKKTQFIFVSATFRKNDRAPLREACSLMERESYGAGFKEVYLNHRELLLKKVRQFQIFSENYEMQKQTLLQLCQTLEDSSVSKSILIIPMGEEGGGKGMGQMKQMNEIFELLKPQFAEGVVDTFSGTRPMTEADKKAGLPANRKGMVKYTDAERTAKMAKFQKQSIKYMIATTMDRGINIPNLTHVILFGMATKTYNDNKLEDEYLQRVGRCGRAGKSGCSIVLWNRPEEMDGRSCRGDPCGMTYVQQKLDMGDASKGTENVVIARAPGLSPGLNGPPSRAGQLPIVPALTPSATVEDVKQWWKTTFKVKHG
jgi:superfamily II DNA/RNA helicase